MRQHRLITAEALLCAQMFDRCAVSLSDYVRSWSFTVELMLSVHEFRQLTTTLWFAANMVKHHLTTASIMVKMLQYTTTEITSTWLLPEMVLRVANMLNYFLQFLTGRLSCVLSVLAPCMSPSLQCMTAVLATTQRVCYSMTLSCINIGTGSEDFKEHCCLWACILVFLNLWVSLVCVKRNSSEQSSQKSLVAQGKCYV